MDKKHEAHQHAFKKIEEDRARVHQMREDGMIDHVQARAMLSAMNRVHVKMVKDADRI